MRRFLLATFGLFAILTLNPSTASARDEIRIGVTGTFTGPAAAIGIPYRQASELFPSQVAGKPVKWIVLDDGGDPAAAVKNARRFVDEDQVDAIMGSTSPPGSMAMFDVATESKTPQLSLAPVPIPADKRTWLFNVPQAVPIMVSAIVDDMAAKKVKTVGYIGFTDSWGDQNYAALQKLAEAKGIKVVGNERYNRVDTSVTAQALKIFTENPDVVFIGGSASPAVLPHLALRDLG
ncbi:MAG: ABC transporter substrate-binding protein, partial [Bradyrhizobium sp.]